MKKKFAKKHLAKNLAFLTQNTVSLLKDGVSRKDTIFMMYTMKKCEKLGYLVKNTENYAQQHNTHTYRKYL
jgi:hypothetical protein